MDDATADDASTMGWADTDRAIHPASPPIAIVPLNPWRDEVVGVVLAPPDTTTASPLNPDSISHWWIPD